MFRSNGRVCSVRTGKQAAARDQVGHPSVVGIPTSKAGDRRRSFVWPALLVCSLVTAIGFWNYHALLGLWSVIAMATFGSVLLAIALTIGVCGSLAYGVISWACRQTLQLKQHRAAMKRHRAIFGPHRTPAEERHVA